MNPRWARNVALTKPTETERGQWYFQRYVSQFPTAGEFVTFDRSWYNRAGVEPVMGFCTPEQHAQFLKQAPRFEKMIVHEGIHFFKFWLDIGRETQLKRFHDRRHDPLKIWKLSPMDVAGMNKWDDYTEKRDLMFERTHSQSCAMDRRARQRQAACPPGRDPAHRASLSYAERDLDAIGKQDGKIIGEGPRFLAG